jgi:hypothetical protein
MVSLPLSRRLLRVSKAHELLQCFSVVLKAVSDISFIQPFQIAKERNDQLWAKEESQLLAKRNTSCDFFYLIFSFLSGRGLWDPLWLKMKEICLCVFGCKRVGRCYDFCVGGETEVKVRNLIKALK